MAKNTQPTQTGGFMRGLFWGGLIGAALVLWYAPKSGQQFQAYFFRQWAKLRKKATQTGGQLYDSAWETTNQTLDQVEKLQQEGLAYVKEQGGQLQEQLESAKTKLKQVTS